jgi:hypothetical protein
MKTNLTFLSLITLSVMTCQAKLLTKVNKYLPTRFEQSWLIEPNLQTIEDSFEAYVEHTILTDDFSEASDLIIFSGFTDSEQENSEETNAEYMISEDTDLGSMGSEDMDIEDMSLEHMSLEHMSLEHMSSEDADLKYVDLNSMTDS